MSGFEPGEGWREIDVSSEEAAVHAVYQLAEYDEHTGALKRAWVRVPPVPPLPTEEHTSIKVTWRSDLPEEDPVFTLRKMTPGFRWWNERGPSRPAWLAERITGFEVLAEPRKPQPLSDQDFADKVRRETAKAVIDRVLNGNGILSARLDAIALEFGVTA